MYCENCGTQVNEDELFCKNCGVKITTKGNSISEDVIREDTTDAYLILFESLSAFMLIVITPIGLVFSILKIKSDKKTIAIMGTILNSLSLIVILLL